MTDNCALNGGMNIDTRNAGGSKIFTAGSDYDFGGIDMWFAYCTGANIAGQQINGGYGNRKMYQFTGAASVTGIGFGTRIKASDTYHLNGGDAMVSVDIASSLLTTITWTAYYANGNDAFGTKAIPNKTQIATGTLNVSAGNTRHDISLAIPNAACTGLEILFTGGALTSGTLVFGNFDVYSGNTPRAFVPNVGAAAAAEEFACMKHCEKGMLAEIAPHQNFGHNNGESHFLASGNGTVNSYAFIPFKAPKYRQSSGLMPNVTLYNPSANNAEVRDIGAAVNCSGTTITGSVWDKGFQIRTTGHANTQANTVLAIGWLCEANIL